MYFLFVNILSWLNQKMEPSDLKLTFAGDESGFNENMKNFRRCYY
jgi:hypothetical protein